MVTKSGGGRERHPVPGSLTFRGLNGRYRRRINAAVADGWCLAACAHRREARQTLETDIQQPSRRRARQSRVREYELIWLLQQRLRAVSWPHWRLRCMQPLLSHGPTAWELSDLDHSHAAIPQRVTCASCAQLLRSMCLAPPAVDLLEALGRCV